MSLERSQAVSKIGMGIDAMDDAKPTDHKTEDSAELVSHYRPLGLKAVLAACAVKAQPTLPRPELPELSGNLPEGFHMPHGLDD